MNPPIIIYRIGNFFYQKRFITISKLITWLNRFLFSTYLPSSAKIGKNFKIGYWGLGCVIHSNSVIGNDCTIAQNVTIGRNFSDKKVPIIKNNVYIATGSAVFGEITIGNNVIIGANSVVNKSIPDNTIAAGNPAKIIKSSN
ncbi:serine acetyltransferase [Flammeovirga pectinis]|uniref:Serine acetyltransferase n=1 Tax=Flammeovirga pectinis TaxID=2494373 RepID=A0A3Q9FPK1_9BACT|nr:serine acetyltransferase [Flammeovirga pectinis]AZQ64599.1 serine acetyltransferase [Flammeovirga pectinis]